MALSLEQMRARIQEQENPTQTYTNKASELLPFWNIKEDEEISLRFLPDGDSSNDFFWLERDMINLTFNGVKGQHNDFTKVSVPCNEMWDKVNSCPILVEVRKWWGTEFEEQARKYWKKKSYLMQCMVVGNNPIKEESPENPIRRVILNKQIFNQVKSILKNTEIEYLPFDYEHGRDFKIIKSKNSGGYAEYNGSYKFNERSLSQEERDAIAQHGLFNLSEFMPKRPTPEELVCIREMFEASLAGEAYDPERWAHLPWRPHDVQQRQAPSAPVMASNVQPQTQAPVSQVQTPQPQVNQTLAGMGAQPSVQPQPQVQVQEHQVQVQEQVQQGTALSPQELIAQMMQNKG